MAVVLNPGELETLIEALGYAYAHARDAWPMAAAARAERLARIEALAAKLRTHRTAGRTPWER